MHSLDTDRLQMGTPNLTHKEVRTTNPGWRVGSRVKITCRGPRFVSQRLLCGSQSQGNLVALSASAEPKHTPLRVHDTNTYM